MPELADYRLYKRKRLKNSDDENIFLDVPVLYEARFKCMAEQAQESFIYIDNSIASSRKVHTKRVTNNQDSSQYIDVERIDEWHVRTIQEQAQERTFVLTNTDPPPIQPDGSNNPAHEKTHCVRYFKDNDSDSDTWADFELIDELKIKCIQEQAQEWIYYLKHPPIGPAIDDPDVPYTVTLGYCDESLELIEGGQDIDPPYRFDPFRNCINISWFSEQTTTLRPCTPFDGDYIDFGSTGGTYMVLLPVGPSNTVKEFWYLPLSDGLTPWPYGDFGEALSQVTMMAAESDFGCDCGKWWYLGPAPGVLNPNVAIFGKCMPCPPADPCLYNERVPHPDGWEPPEEWYTQHEFPA